MVFHRKAQFAAKYSVVEFQNLFLNAEYSRIKTLLCQVFHKLWKMAVENSKFTNFLNFIKNAETILLTNGKITRNKTHNISDADAFKKVSAKFLFLYSKYPAAATIAPLSPQRERGGRINVTCMV